MEAVGRCVVIVAIVRSKWAVCSFLIGGLSSWSSVGIVLVGWGSIRWLGEYAVFRGF